MVGVVALAAGNETPGILFAGWGFWAFAAGGILGWWREWVRCHVDLLRMVTGECCYERDGPLPSGPALLFRGDVNGAATEVFELW